jgi:hypothetical protein
VLIFVSGCTDLLLKVVDALYGVSRLRLSACQISLLSSVSFPLVVCISEWLTHGEVIMSRGHPPCESESVHDQCYEDGTER